MEGIKFYRVGKTQSKKPQVDDRVVVAVEANGDGLDFVFDVPVPGGVTSARIKLLPVIYPQLISAMIESLDAQPAPKPLSEYSYRELADALVAKAGE